MIPVVSAVELSDPPSQGEMTPYALYIKGKNLEFRISDGKATVKGWVTGQTGVADRCKVVAYLQEKSGTTWKTVALSLIHI